MSRKILIVDDEPAVVDLIADYLSDIGWSTVSAGSVSEALAQVHRQLFDVALIDFQLPDGNGVGLHQQLRRIDEELAARCVFMSGNSQDDEDLVYFNGYGGFVSKPFDLSDLARAVETACHG